MLKKEKTSARPDLGKNCALIQRTLQFIERQWLRYPEIYRRTNLRQIEQQNLAQFVSFRFLSRAKYGLVLQN
jgi:hypothetical protein